MSARRLEDSPKDYRYYVTRFDRTYKAHQINKRILKIPPLIFMSIYYPAKMIRAVHSARSPQAGKRGGTPQVFADGPAENP